MKKNLRFPFQLVVWFSLCAAFAFSAEAIIFTNDTVIAANDFSYDGADIVVSNCTVTVEGTHTFASLAINPGGIVTHSNSTGMTLSITGNVEVATGGAISVNGKGFAADSGPGAGTTNPPLGGSGAGYGGFGGNSSSNAIGGAAYGIFGGPIESGSGGGGAGGAGGGAVKILASGTATINGVISANGLNGINSRSGGGSGGSIWLSASRIAGTGAITADGGAGEPPHGGGGGGGRIAIEFGTNEFSGTLFARGGLGATAGGAGSIYTRSTNQTGQVLVDNGGRGGTNTPLQILNHSDLVVRGKASVVPSGNQSLRHLLVASNGTMLLSVSQQLSATGNVTIELGGEIQADGNGFPGGQGPGAGGTLNAGGITTGGGGGSGGYGSPSTSGAVGGAASGFLFDPQDLGSGGGSGNGISPANLGGPGGGVVRLTVFGTLRVDGRLSANGRTGTAPGSGGGAGGSIWFTAHTLSGSGIVSANGGNGNGTGGGGGGGRIAFTPTTNLFTGNVTALGGGGGGGAGGAGTIVEMTFIGGINRALVRVDNGGAIGARTTLGSGPVSGTLLDLNVVNGGSLIWPSASAPSLLNFLLGSGCTLVVTNPVATTITILSNATVQAGGLIIADGGGFPSGQGSGFGRTSFTNPYGQTGGGAGFGGIGGQSVGGAQGGNSYGQTILQPVDRGSGGGAGPTVNSGGTGGGALRLSVNGLLRVDGKVAANGFDAMGLNAGGGSGGSLWLSVGSIAGTGTISANGGAGNGYGGGGSGGRVALTYASNLFTGVISAFGGPGGGGIWGGAGTVYSKANISLSRALVDNAGHEGITPFGFEVSELTVAGRSTVLYPNATTLANLFIRSNSTMIATNTQGLLLTITNNATIETSAVLSADGAGFPMGQGSGVGSTLFVSGFGYTGGGGGYGGFGGNSATGAGGGVPYGISMSQPTDRGSGGGGNPIGAGSVGGGALRLNVGRNLLVNGIISANGRDAIGLNSGGGSGGSVWLTAGTLLGSGKITANGGAGNNLGGGGGGGRIGIQFGTNAFAGSMTAFGGSGTLSGGAGTVYTSTNNSRAGQVVVENNGVPGSSALAPATDTYSLSIGNGVRAAMTYNSSSSLVLNNLFIASNGALIFTNSAPILLALPSVGAITVNGDVTIEAGGLFGADGAGSAAANGQGAGLSSTGSGGGHGGMGVRFGTAGGSGTYGLALQPTTAGSGGGPSTGFAATGGGGGGIIRLTVNGKLQLDGKISADGRSGVAGSGTSGPNYSGGGSGGSIWLTIVGFFGSGTITANGGNGFNAGGGGGGGRIAVYYQTNNFSGTIRALGGNNGVSNLTAVAGAGTVFTTAYNAAGQSVGQLFVDNGGRLGTNSTVPDGATFDLTVRNGAILTPLSQATYRNVLVGSNGWLLVTNQFVTINSNATVLAGGGIIADGTGSTPGQGTGAGRPSQSSTGSGGGYGGYGASSGSASGGTAYSTASAPSSAGSGGGTSIGPGGFGGGIVRLSVTGALTNDGRISANGTMGEFNSGGGSGGSVYLTVGKLSGTGVISANGGSGAGPGGGGGGGGRISIIYGVKSQNSATNDFTGLVQALGGASGPTNPAGYGGAGTIYISSLVQSVPQLIADNGGHAGTNTLLGEPQISDLTIRGGAVAVSGVPSIFLRNLLIESNSWFSASNNFLNISAAATINTGAGIVADRKGFPGGQGTGAGATVFSSFYGNTGGGGGHGGYGAASIAGAAGGNAYDFITNFSNGSGGGGGPPNSAGAGGGLVRLSAPSLVLNGRISAEGGDGVFQHGGGGSGGGVTLSVGTLSGNGIISANGGAANGVGGGGGGGRIDLVYSTNNFAGALRAWGGVGGGGVGGAGTVFTRRSGETYGQVTVGNGSLFGTNTPLPILTNVGLTVADGAIVHPANGFFILSNLLVGANGVVSSFDGQTNLNISVIGNAVIAAGGTIASDGLGFAQATGPGAGQTSSGYGSGAGYGGPGGDSATAPGGIPYGSALQPIDRGSGGGLGSGPIYSASQGGGAIRLNVGGTLTVNGRLGANGNVGVQDNAGGGSGGSVWVDTGILNGNGQITADGGDGELYGGGGGGGGRIAIYRHRNSSPTNNFTGYMSAFGGEGAQWGGDGTIFLSSGFGALQVQSQTPTGTATGAVTFVDLEFNAAVNPYSFAIDDVLLTRSGSVVSNLLSITALSPTRFRVNFQALPVAGAYSIIVGPQIENLYGQSMSQVYTGAFAVSLPVVQGTITDTNGAPVSDVLLQPTGGFAASTTDANGNYAIGFVPGASFTVTPIKAGLMFAPANRTYINLGATSSNQNYVAVDTIAANLSSGINNGMMEISWYGISGVNYQLYTSTDLVSWVPYGGLNSGGNSIMSLSVPVGPEPVRYFRVRASN